MMAAAIVFPLMVRHGRKRAVVLLHTPLTWMRGTVEGEPCVRAHTTFLWRAETTVPISGGKPSGHVNDMKEQDHASA